MEITIIKWHGIKKKTWVTNVCNFEKKLLLKTRLRVVLDGQVISHTYTKHLPELNLYNTSCTNSCIENIVLQQQNMIKKLLEGIMKFMHLFCVVREYCTQEG